MKYRWNSEQLGSIFALPAAVVDQHIRMAGSAQLKVLLWFSRHGGGCFDAADCSAAIGLSPADCADAMQYWVEAKVLLPCSAEEQQEQAETKAEAVSTADKQSAPPVPKILPRPQPVKPQMKEVLARQKSSPEFDYLLQTASARLGRPITHGDMETLLYLYDTAGLPAEVILMIIVYAVSSGKNNMRYIEKMALDWADKGINTIAAAEIELCSLERQREAANHLTELLGLQHELTIAQRRAAEKWFCEWKMPDELVKLAYEQCLAKTGKFQVNYMSKVLEHWYLDGLQTVEEVEAHNQRGGIKAKKPAAKPLLSDPNHPAADFDEYEDMVRRYTPVYKAE